MSLSAGECEICNQALLKVGDKSELTVASQASVQGVKMNLFYTQCRDALLRSYTWYWAETECQLYPIQTLTMSSASTPSAFAVGATLTGSTGVTCTVLSVTSSTIYVVAYLGGTFIGADTITDGTNSVACSAGFPTAAELIPTDIRWKHQYQLPVNCLRVDWRHRHQGNVFFYHSRFTIEGRTLFTNKTPFYLHYIKQVTDTTMFDPMFTEVLILRLALKMSDYLTIPEVRKQSITAELKEATSRARTVMAAETNTTGYSNWNLSRYGSGKVFPIDPTRIE